MTDERNGMHVSGGHPCESCGATVPECDQHIKDHGRGCCSRCYSRDTHGLLGQVVVRPISGDSLADLIEAEGRALLDTTDGPAFGVKAAIAEGYFRAAAFVRQLDVSADQPSTGEHEGHRLRHARGYGLVCVDENGDLCTHDPPQLDGTAGPVPEPATNPCEHSRPVAIDDYEACPDCGRTSFSPLGGSGVATTEGNQQ